MKRLSQTIWLLMSVLMLVQCKTDDPIQIEINKRHDEVMVIHDEVMPKMRDIYKLRKKLKALPENEEINKMIASLESADEGMMDWMHQYDKPSSKSTGYNEYLDEQMDLIKIVRDDMLNAISEAENYLGDENN